MPNIPYFYEDRDRFPVLPGETCVPGGPGANLPLAGPMRFPTWPAMMHAQIQLGIYPPGWVIEEMMWRAASLRSSAAPQGAIGALDVSPVITQVDPTDRAQLAYHLGMACGLEAGLALLNPGPGAYYFACQLSRAQANGGGFTFAGGQRPDLLLFSLTLPPAWIGGPPVLNHFVVWECKGHAINVGTAPLGPALDQTLALISLNNLPGAAPFAVPLAPAARVASQIDRAGAALPYRMQVTDPDGVGTFTAPLTPDDANGFLMTYYAPYLEMLGSGVGLERRRYNGRDFETVVLLPNTRVGIDSKLAHLFSGGVSSDLYLKVGSVLAEIKPLVTSEACVGPTGLSTEMHLPF